MSTAICWMRRDLRLHDHAALFHALSNHESVQLVFCFDPHILNKLSDKSDLRVSFILQSLQDIEAEVIKKGASLKVLFGLPEDEIVSFAQSLKAQAVYCNRDYEPYAKKRDSLVEKKLKNVGIEFFQYKDSVVFEKTEVLNGSGAVYKVFTPYKNKWLEKLAAQDNHLPDFKISLKNLREFKNPESVLSVDWHAKIGFTPTHPLLAGGTHEAMKRLKKFMPAMPQYAEARNIPALDGTSNLSPYIRHGCLSVRDMVRAGLSQKNEGATVWLSEVVWRDFYHMILDTHPYVEKESFKRDYDKIQWLGKKEWFEAWCEGRTGFPLVDAAMRCLNQTGLMHNRLRMVTASFLCKTLLIDWRWGEKYFAEKLLDFDLAANNGGWQWSSSTGCDAQPYFRIFNPYSQSEKFDSEGIFIREFIPELSHLSATDIHCPPPLLAPDYYAPIVSYEKMRGEALKMYSVIKN
ncbi:MAG: DNA photolyase family protein [Bacteriovoracaceae bacterium]|nr:DNA photolyase family protein [Bacteriovoracaceae bacterium]